MRLLIVNPNTSAGVTARIREAAEAVAHPGDRFTVCSAAFGPALIVTQEDAKRAVQGVLAAVAAHAGPVDGIVLGSFGDTGAEEVRAIRPGLPVVGIAGAAFAAARALGGSFGIVTFGTRLAPSLRQSAERHGHGEALLGVAALEDVDLEDPGSVQARCADGLADLARGMAARGASSVVLGGGPLAGLAGRIDAGIPLIDGTQAAVGLLRGATRKTRGDASAERAV